MLLSSSPLHLQPCPECPVHLTFFVIWEASGRRAAVLSDVASMIC